MKIVKYAAAFAFCGILANASFAVNIDAEYKGAVRAVPGTETVVVGLPLDAEKAPDRSLLKLKIVMYPGQKIVLAGPEEFQILFKNKKTPNRKVKNSSAKGVVIIQIPRDLLEKAEHKEELLKNGSVKFNFGVRANGKEIDPEIIVIRRL